MVGYGAALRASRRKGWEEAYLDYEQLRCLLEDMVKSPGGALMIEREFLKLLREQASKCSLFILTRQGEIAESLGALRHPGLTIRQLVGKPRQSLEYLCPEEVEDTLGEQAALLPSESILIGAQKTPKVTAKSPSQQMFRMDDSFFHSRDDTETLTILSVELLHLLRFVYANAMGIRKIYKKYDKTMLRLNLPAKPRNESKDPFSAAGPVDHLENLANSESVAAIHDSLRLALQEMEEEQRNGDVEKPLSARNVLLRFKCAVLSISVLREYAQRMDETFKSFLSQKAMIRTGNDSGGLTAATQQALQVVMRFQPDSLLLMDDAALIVWNDRVFGDDIETIEGHDSLEATKRSWGGVNSPSMALNLASTLLYTVNYYIVAPTANSYAILLGTDGAFGATLVGASSLAAIFAALLYSFWYTRYSSFGSALFFSALCPCLGNILYSLAMSYESMTMALVGRILVGFGSAEVVNRQLISACVSFRYMTEASALFVAAGASGMSIGPLVAAILDILSGRDTDVDLWLPFLPSGGIIYNHVTSPGFLMAGLWFLQMVVLALLFHEPLRVNAKKNNNTRTAYSSLPKKLSQNPKSEERHIDYGSIEDRWYKPNVSLLNVGKELVDIGRLIFGNLALPVTMLLFGLIELVDEVLISSCAMVCRRYFSWHGSKAGFLIASLGALVIPAHYFVERASRHFHERRIMKVSILFIVLSLVGILNYEGLVFDLIGVAVEAVAPSDSLSNSTEINISVGGTDIKSVLNKEYEVPYDWGFGKFIYVTFLSAAFMGTIILEGVDTSLMAKATPPALNDTFINSGLLATLVGTLGRVVGDTIITVGALFDKNVFTDFVNATFSPLILLATGGYWLVRRTYTLFSIDD